MIKSRALYVLILATVYSVMGCSGNDDPDCFKTITIPQFYAINNQFYYYDRTLEVPCDFPEPKDPVEISPPALENFTYNILSFNFIPDTGNNTSRLQFEIELLNPNNFGVSGVPILTISVDGLESRGSFSNNASVPCYEIDPNSSCILTYDQQESLDVALISSIELINVEYFLTN